MKHKNRYRNIPLAVVIPILNPRMGFLVIVTIYRRNIRQGVFLACVRPRSTRRGSGSTLVHIVAVSFVVLIVRDNTV